MWSFILVIQMVFISLTSTQQQFFNNPERWSFFVTPIQISPFPSSTSWLSPIQPVVKRDDYTYTPGIGGHKFHTRVSTWNEARRTCVEEGGHLAIINSIAEANAINDLWNKSIGIIGSWNWAHIGFHDLYEEGEYVTVHSHSLAKAGYTQWRNGEPSSAYGGTEEDCGSVDKNGGLNDISCTVKIPFICEIDEEMRK